MIHLGLTVFKISFGELYRQISVGNLVLRRRASGAIKRDFETYIRRCTSQKDNFEYDYYHSNAFLQFYLELELCKPHKAACHSTKCDVIYDVKQFRTVYALSQSFDVIQSAVALQKQVH